jgi:hypothetical protein
MLILQSRKICASARPSVTLHPRLQPFSQQPAPRTLKVSILAAHHATFQYYSSSAGTQVPGTASLQATLTYQPATPQSGPKRRGYWDLQRTPVTCSTSFMLVTKWQPHVPKTPDHKEDPLRPATTPSSNVNNNHMQRTGASPLTHRYAIACPVWKIATIPVPDSHFHVLTFPAPQTLHLQQEPAFQSFSIEMSLRRNPA